MANFIAPLQSPFDHAAKDPEKNRECTIKI